MARPGIEPRTPDLRVRCPIDCATRPGDNDGHDTYSNDNDKNNYDVIITIMINNNINLQKINIILITCKIKERIYRLGYCTDR